MYPQLLKLPYKEVKEMEIEFFYTNFNSVRTNHNRSISS